MVSFDGGSASKVDDVTALPSRHKMADMCYYGNVMTTTRWRLYVILHLQQYSHRLNLFFFCHFINEKLSVYGYWSTITVVVTVLSAKSWKGVAA